MAENTQSVLERTAADQWKVLPSGLTVLVRPMPGYSGTHVIYATRFGSIDRDFRLGEREVHLPAGVAHFLEHKMFEDEDGDAALQHILRPERMAVMYIEPDGTAVEEDEEEETEE